MKRGSLRRVAAATTIGILLSVFIQRADANSATWMFTMDLRAVDGEKNKTLHPLNAGALTLDGSIWVTGKLARATSEPDPVKLVVMKSGFLNGGTHFFCFRSAKQSIKREMLASPRGWNP